MDNSVHYDVLNTARAAMAMASSSARRTAAIAPDSHDAAVRHVKRRTCDLDFDTLECPVCTHLLYPPVFQVLLLSSFHPRLLASMSSLTLP
jgi:hypothetical protein